MVWRVDKHTQVSDPYTEVVKWWAGGWSGAEGGGEFMCLSLQGPGLRGLSAFSPQLKCSSFPNRRRSLNSPRILFQCKRSNSSSLMLDGFSFPPQCLQYDNKTTVGGPTLRETLRFLQVCQNPWHYSYGTMLFLRTQMDNIYISIYL